MSSRKDILTLPDQDLQQVRAEINSELNLRRQRSHLEAFAGAFTKQVDPALKHSQGELFSKFVELVNNLRVLESEGALESTSHEIGSIKLSVPGLADGVTVSRSTDHFSINEGTSLLERNEIRIKMGGLDAYSGYWLALDSPIANPKDAMQEEGIGTLRRLISSANISPADGVAIDALQYPFVAALISPFGPSAIRPFEDHLSMLHEYYDQPAGGSWYKTQTSESKLRSAERGEYLSLQDKPRAVLTTFEEAELELEKLDL